MRRIAIIVTDHKPAEDILVRALADSEHEIITVRPDGTAIRKELEKIKKRRGAWEIRCYIQKELADFTRSMLEFIGLQAEVEEIKNIEEDQALNELADLWRVEDD